MVVIVDDAHWPRCPISPGLDVPCAPARDGACAPVCWPSETVRQMRSTMPGCPSSGYPAWRRKRRRSWLDRHGSGPPPERWARAFSRKRPEIRWHWPSFSGLGRRPRRRGRRSRRLSSPLPLDRRSRSRRSRRRLAKLHATTRTPCCSRLSMRGALVELDQAARILIGTDVSLDDWTEAVSAGLGVKSASSFGFRFRHPLIRLGRLPRRRI